MANIRKSFSFRNGVQVDENNFVVNANGLVGIGTSVPGEILDVRGTTKVVGLVTASDVFVSGVATITEIQVGTAITIASGVISATSFFGDGATLSNLPTSQWTDVDVGLGFTSIHSAGNVGIATTDPRTSFQVGGTPGVAGKIGVGINSIGNIHATGIVTAASFVGAIAGPVTGDVTGDLTGDVTGNTAGTHTGGVTGNINSTGVSTFNSLNATNAVISGIATVGTALSFADLKVATFGNNHELEIKYDKSQGSSGLGGRATIDCSAGELVLSAGGSLNVGQVRIQPNGGEDGINVVHNGQVELYHDNVKRLNTTTTGVRIANDLRVGTPPYTSGFGTVFSALSTGKVGIGTNLSLSDLTIKKPSGTTVEVIAESGVPNLTVGLTGDTKNKGILRFNSEANTLDIINNDTGDLNFILDGDNNSGSGNIKFIDNTTERARITNDGKLGIAITNPAHQLHVVGTSTVTGNAFVGGNLSVGGTISGALSLGNVIEGTNVLTTSGISTFNQVNFTSSVGFGSAIPKVDVDFQTAVASFSGVGIGTTNPGNRLKVVGTSFFETIGINTTAVKIDTTHNPGGLQMIAERLYLYDSQLRLDLSRQSKIGFGTAGDTLSGSIDLRKAGGAISPWAFLPEMTTSVRNTKTTAVGQSASGIGTGAVIYNTTTKRVEIYLPDGDTTANVTNWVGIATV